MTCSPPTAPASRPVIVTLPRAWLQRPLREARRGGLDRQRRRRARIPAGGGEEEAPLLTGCAGDERERVRRVGRDEAEPGDGRRRDRLRTPRRAAVGRVQDVAAAAGAEAVDGQIAVGGRAEREARRAPRAGRDRLLPAAPAVGRRPHAAGAVEHVAGRPARERDVTDARRLRRELHRAPARPAVDADEQALAARRPGEDRRARELHVAQRRRADGLPAMRSNCRRRASA